VRRLGYRPKTAVEKNVTSREPVFVPRVSRDGSSPRYPVILPVVAYLWPSIRRACSIVGVGMPRARLSGGAAAAMAR